MTKSEVLLLPAFYVAESVKERHF